jgi:hypothetical protein
MIGPYIKDSLYIQSWMRPVLDSCCPNKPNCRFGSINVKYTKLESKYETIYRTTQDHSKWCVGSKEPVVCIGDINRGESQHYRAGGMLCLKNVNVWRAFTKIIFENDNCNIQIRKIK